MRAEGVRRRSLVLALAVVCAPALSACSLASGSPNPTVGTPAGATSAQIHQEVLSSSDLPPGWTLAPMPLSGQSAEGLGPLPPLDELCPGTAVTVPGLGAGTVEVSFVQGTGNTVAGHFVEVIDDTDHAQSAFDRIAASMAGCRPGTQPLNGAQVPLHLATIPFTRLGTSTRAWSVTGHQDGVSYSSESVLTRKGHDVVLLAVDQLRSTVGLPMDSLARTAVGKVF